MAKDTNNILDCLNIPKHALYTPIAEDYVKFNESENFGEVYQYYAKL